MQSESVLAKSERQRLIASVVTRKRIGTQFELLAALADAGCRVTQATVSRDLRELGLEKAHDPLGRPRYVLPEARRADPHDALRRVLGEFGRDVTAAQNIVVVRSEHASIVGTLAGDDTCLIIASDANDASALARELGALLG